MTIQIRLTVKSSVINMQDIILSVTVGLVFFAEGIFASLIAVEWRNLISNLDILTTFGIDVILGLRDALAATAVRLQ